MPSPPPDDFELMLLIEQQNPGALSQLYDRYGGLVFTLGLRMLRDRGEAEELVSDVFLELWRRCERYDSSRGAPLAYLVTLARSRAIDRQRSAAFRAKTNLSAADSLDSGNPSAAPDPPSSAIIVENRKRVRAALQQLEPPYRQAVELAFFDGLSHTQIAQRLDKPLGTIKTYVRQGLIRLRDCLRKE
ncbi:MAG TPA: sigma-70 family RNA polymerase sigma factor [Tepidisphaeraceae bacterium]